MNVTSLLSNGYLQPANLRAPQYRPTQDSGDTQSSSASLVQEEQQILAQERLLKISSGSNAQVATTYSYSVGPDGRRYISGAEVSIKTRETKGGETAVGGIKREELKSRSPQTAKNAQEDSTQSKSGEPDSETIQKLKQTEREVVAHEAAHQAAGGRFAGPVSYTYTQGPDGKSYITGGEVPINIPASSDPEQTLRDMAQGQRAALAPGTPSGQDLSVAAQTAAKAALARQEVTAKKSENPFAQSPEGSFKTGASSIQAGIRFEELYAEESSLENADAKPRPPEPDEPKEAYARNSSAYGLWALGRGFEPREEKPLTTGIPFDFAA